MSLDVASPLPHTSEESYKTAWDRAISVCTPHASMYSALQMTGTASN